MKSIPLNWIKSSKSILSKASQPFCKQISSVKHTSNIIRNVILQYIKIMFLFCFVPHTVLHVGQNVWFWFYLTWAQFSTCWHWPQCSLWQMMEGASYRFLSTMAFSSLLLLHQLSWWQITPAEVLISAAHQRLPWGSSLVHRLMFNISACHTFRLVFVQIFLLL